MYKYLFLSALIAFISCANFDPETDSFMKECEIEVGLADVQNDLSKGYIDNLTDHHLRLTAYVYDAVDDSLLITYREVIPYDQNTAVLRIPLVDTSIENRIVVIADFVTMNSYGDVYSDCSFLWESSYESFCLASNNTHYSVDNVYYADFILHSGERSAKVNLKDCYKDIVLTILNALTINELTLKSTYESYFFFSTQEPQYIVATINVLRPESDTLTMHLKHLGMSDTAISIYTDEDISIIDIDADHREVDILYDPVSKILK